MRFLLIAFLLFSTQLLQAQILKKIIDKTKEKTEERVSEKISDKVSDAASKSIDDVTSEREGKKSANTDKNSSDSKENLSNSNEHSSQSNLKNSSKQESNLVSYSKYDFVPGEKIFYLDDFDRAQVGDFPTAWNTNSSAQIVTFNNIPGKWLSITKDGYFQPEMIKDLPDNFTLEFDVINRYRSNNILAYNFNIFQTDNARKDISEKYLENTFRLEWQGCTDLIKYNIVEKGEDISGNENIKSKHSKCSGTDFNSPATFRFSLWRQKNRLRIYINEDKVIDIPQAFSSNIKYNAFKLGAEYMNYSNDVENNDEFMVSNFRYAIGQADTRNKLMSEGKFSTTGILFDVNSDKINKVSYGTLKEIANLLQENSDVRVKIIGHTDSDGDDNANIELSKKRAASVKAALAKGFDISESRMETDGMGEKQPVSKNNTAEDKANNRRVEFIKI